MFSKKCDYCSKNKSTGARVVPGMGRLELCDSCKSFVDGPGNQPHNPATIKVQKPMGSKYVGPPAKPQRRR